MKPKHILWIYVIVTLQTLLGVIFFYKNYAFSRRNIARSTSLAKITNLQSNGYNPEGRVDNWTRYRNEWSGERLVMHIGKKRLQFTGNYVKRMDSKGDHPLLKIYPFLETRRRRIQKLCKEYPPENDLLSFSIPGRYLYNQFYEIASCMPPKTSSTQWVKVFSQLAEFKANFSWARTAVLEYRNLSLAYHLSDDQFIAKAFQTYLKFTTVRHPWERLVSAYYDKLIDNKSVYKQDYGPDIIQYNYLEGYPTDEWQLRKRLKQDNASKSEIEWKFKDRSELEQHWRPMALLCNPCTLQYDLVLKFETMHRDANALLDYLTRERQNGPKVNYPEKHVAVTKKKCNQEFSSIPSDILKKLYDIYKEDFALYNYSTSNDNIC